MLNLYRVSVATLSPGLQLCLGISALLIFLASACSNPPVTAIPPSAVVPSPPAPTVDAPKPLPLPTEIPYMTEPAPVSRGEVGGPEPSSIIDRPDPEPTSTIALPVAVKDFYEDKLPSAPDRDLFQLAYELLLPPGHPEVKPVVNDEPVTYEAGRIDEFYLVDLEGLEKYQSTFELRFVSPHAYWYIEEGFNVAQGDIERSAREFEEIIYPRVTEYFGREWTPGVDNDPHLTIVHGDIRGAGGYFSSTDEYPAEIRPHSNQREMIYINISYLPVGSQVYFTVLAHELNHAVMWNHDSSEDTWVSEGLAELSVTVAGYPADSVQRYLQRPYISLVHWPLDDTAIGAHYGGASLFMHYLYEHYSGEDAGTLKNLMAEPADNIAGIDRYLADSGYDSDFRSVLQDWVVANFLDEEDGRFGYSLLEVQAERSRSLNRPDQIHRGLAQYGTHYVELGSKLRESATLVKFEGAGITPLLPTEVPESGCWWSNAGDSMTSTLSAAVDLTGLAEATLEYDLWYRIEEEWDYVYLQVSRDGGQHWQILDTPLTSAADPIGVAFGPGYTGDSKGWQSESVDLSMYAGQSIMVRFQYVTDDALNDMGMCLTAPEFVGPGLNTDGIEWQPSGFVLVDNSVPQEFAVQVIQKGRTNKVLQVPLTYSSAGTWRGELQVDPFAGLERTVVAITAMAPATKIEAEYSLSVESLGR